MKLQQRLALIGFSGIMVAGFVFSQVYIHKRNRQELEEIADELADTWKYKISLDDHQTKLLRNVIIEFTIKKNEVLNGIYTQDGKIARLQAIQRNEHLRLQKFLSEEQFQDYLEMNKQMTQKNFV